MSLRVTSLIAAFAMAFAITAPSWAARNANPSIQGTVQLSATTDVGSKSLAPGEYKVIAQGNEVTFQHAGKTVAEVPCTWKSLPNKASQTETILDHNQLTEIQIAGKTQAIEFSSGAGHSGN